LFVLIAALVLPLLIPLVGVVGLSAPILWLPATLLLWWSAVFLLRTRPRAKSALVGLATLLHSVNAAYLFAFFLQGQGFNSRFFYHLRIDLLYAGVAEFIPLILTFLLLWIALIVAVVLATRYRWRWLSRAQRYGFRLALLIGLTVYPPVYEVLIYLGDFGKKEVSEASLARTLAAIDKLPEVYGKRGLPRKNLVLIYLESVEQSYFDAKYYPNLMPQLSEIKSEALDFTQVAQVPEASWTIAGIFASQCAIPLHSPFSEAQNSPAITRDFMSDAQCLGDSLGLLGYQSHYLGGASLKFAGKGKFLASHGYTYYQGKDQLSAQLEDKSYTHGWGLFDDSLYSFARERFDTLSEQSPPFVLTLLTLDTHHPTGHPSKSCSPYAHNPDKNEMLDALHCADQLASDFIRDIRRGPHSDNTVIVVMSDHLAMRNSIWKRITDYPKARKLLFFIDHPDRSAQTLNHDGTHYDLAATILDVMGYTGFEHYGLGKSLIEGSGYLHDVVDDLTVGDHPLVRERVHELWQDTSGRLSDGIMISKHGALVRLGEQALEFKSDGWMGRAASLIKFAPGNHEIESVEVWPHHAELVPRQLARRIAEDPDAVFLAIAQEKYLPDFVDTLGGSAHKKAKRAADTVVYFLGAAAGTQNIAGALGRGSEVISPQRVNVLVNGISSGNRAISKAFEYRYTVAGGPWDAAFAQTLEAELSVVKSFELTSCSFEACKSHVRFGSKTTSLKRGLTIFGIDASGQYSELGYLDGCVDHPFLTSVPFAELVSRHPQQQSWVLVSDDTVVCRKALSDGDVVRWADATALKGIGEIGYREPYVAIYSAQQDKALEYLGMGEHAVTITFDERGLRRQ